MWNTVTDGFIKNDENIEETSEIEVVDSEIDEEDIAEPGVLEEVSPVESLIRKRHMMLIQQDVNADENNEKGWSNPILSNNKELNTEVEHYQSILEKFKSCTNLKDEKVWSEELDLSFRRIAGYYSNYEYRWYTKMGHLFEEPDLFYDFFYDLLRDCLEQFDSSRKSKQYDNNFRKAGAGVYFNQYFFGALSKRKITNLKKTLNTSNHPSIVCEICGEGVTRVTDYHLAHKYDENRIRRDFKVRPVKVGDNKIYLECPICKMQNVPISHVKTHNYAESITINDYINRYPKTPLSGSIRSLQEPLTMSSEGDILTYEDVYLHKIEEQNDPVEMFLFSSHIDDILKDDPFTAEVLKLKMLDYKDNEIAEKLGDSCVFDLEYDLSKYMKKSDIYEYAKIHMIHTEFFQKYKNKFHIISRVKNNGRETFCISSCAPSQVGQAIKKLRKNKEKIKMLFGDFVIPNV